VPSVAAVTYRPMGPVTVTSRHTGAGEGEAGSLPRLSSKARPQALQWHWHRLARRRRLWVKNAACLPSNVVVRRHEAQAMTPVSLFTVMSTAHASSASGTMAEEPASLFCRRSAV